MPAMLRITVSNWSIFLYEKFWFLIWVLLNFDNVGVSVVNSATLVCPWHWSGNRRNCHEKKCLVTFPLIWKQKELSWEKKCLVTFPICHCLCWLPWRHLPHGHCLWWSPWHSLSHDIWHVSHYDSFICLVDRSMPFEWRWLMSVPFEWRLHESLTAVES